MVELASKIAFPLSSNVEMILEKRINDLYILIMGRQCHQLVSLSGICYCKRCMAIPASNRYWSWWNKRLLKMEASITMNTNNESPDRQARIIEEEDRREKLIDARWKETKKWQQDMLECLRVLRKITNTREFSNGNNHKNGNDTNHRKKV